MSSCFNGKKRARQVGTACLLAMLACGTAQAQSDVGSEPFMSSGAGETRLFTGTTPLRLWHQTQGYGQDASFTSIGARWATDLSDAIGFVDGQFRIDNNSKGGGNIGGGFRWFQDGLLVGDPRIWGVSTWYDGQESSLNKYFNQIGVSFESLGQYIDLRLNANIPLDELKRGDTSMMTDDLTFSGNSLGITTLTPTDVALRVVDFEVAARVFDFNLWAYGGGYEMDGEGVSALGRKGGMRGYLTNDLVLGVGVTDDDIFGTNTVVQVIWTPGRTGAGPSWWKHELPDRMREQVYRNQYIALDRTQTEGTVTLANADGTALRIVHVDSDAAAGGDGTVEHPLNSLNEIQGHSQAGDIILAHADSTFLNQTATLQDQQRLLGEGGGVTHSVNTQQLGVVTLPESFSGALNEARPVINNGGNATDAVVLAGVSNTNTSTFSPIEVNNFDIIGGDNAITSGGVGAVTIANLDISSTSGNAIQLAALNENNDADAAVDQVRFSPTITNVDFHNIGGDDIQLTSSTQPAATPTTEAIRISTITSTGGNGVGIELLNTRSTANISDISWIGDADSTGAIRIQDALSTANINVSGANTITGTAVNASPSTTGFGIALVDSDANVTVSGMTMTDTPGASIIADGGTSAGDFTFSGSISQSRDAVAVLNVVNGHDGNMTFTAATSGGDVITATDGSGLQFNDADGAYTFNGGVVFTGVDAGINVAGDSAGTLTLQDAQITNATGTAIHFDAGTMSMTYSGKITQTAQDQLILSVTGGHDGTLTFNDLSASPGVISATRGDGLSFDNADGAYVFNDNVALSGADEARIAVTNGSEGTFTFSDADITVSAGNNAAVTIANSNVQAFTHSGDITLTAPGASAARPVSITGNTGGSITFNGVINDTAGLGIEVTNNTNTTVLFAGQTTLTTTTNTAVSLANNTSGGIRFNALDITTTSGTGFDATSTDNVTVAGAGNTITTTTGIGLNLNDVSVSGIGIMFDQVSVSNGSSSGIVLNDVTGGAVTIGAQGVNPGDGGTIAAAAAAVSITNAANVSLNNMTLSSTAAQGVDYHVTTAPASRLTLNNNLIDNTAAGALQSVALDVSGNATLANITIRNNDLRNTDDEALLLNTSGATIKTVNLLVENNENITNNSADANVAAANFQASGSTTLNATVRGNTFTNTDGATGRPFEMASNSGGTTVRLDLNGNSATASGGGDEYFLEENGGDFNVKDLAGTAAGTRNNSGTVNFFPNQAAFDDEPGTITTP